MFILVSPGPTHGTLGSSVCVSSASDKRRDGGVSTDFVIVIEFVIILVGTTGFEPATLCSQSARTVNDFKSFAVKRVGADPNQYKRLAAPL